jgi:pimeloyl-ACP methyl ester carboxylesterase
MMRVQSADGTMIAYDRQGDGPPLIIVDGALTTRWSGSKPRLAENLAPTLSVYVYDRRGRGDSGDTLPYALEREIEDITAIIATAGAPVFLYGHSSGACLALEAAAVLGEDVARLALYDAPYNDDPAAQGAWQAYLATLTKALADGRRGDAVAAFMAQVGMPAEQIEGMRHSPFWAVAESIAPTLAYDHIGAMNGEFTVPRDRVADIAAPTLVLHGAASPPFMADTARTLAKTMPAATLRGLDGQTHDVDPVALAPALVEFFGNV